MFCRTKSGKDGGPMGWVSATMGESLVVFGNHGTHPAVLVSTLVAFAGNI